LVVVLVVIIGGFNLAVKADLSCSCMAGQGCASAPFNPFDYACRRPQASTARAIFSEAALYRRLVQTFLPAALHVQAVHKPNVCP
jgi:hypothetical protein